MALVVICGQPSSGKSRIAAELKKLAAEASPSLEIVLIDDELLHLNRNTAYENLRMEKDTRGHIRATVDRLLTKKKLVILDSLNNIKGYRYEIYCIARAAGVRYCMVHVDTEVETCRAWNKSRPESDQYKDVVFEDLAGRFERPDGKNRWDAPLFTLNPAGSSYESTLPPMTPEAAAAAVEKKLSDIIYAMLDVRPGASTVASTSTRAANNTAAGDDTAGPPDLDSLSLEDDPAAPVAKQLKPHLSTYVPQASAPNLLHDVDKATQEVIMLVNEAQANAPPGAPFKGAVTVPGVNRQVMLNRLVTIAELRRHKRNFLKLATTSSIFERCSSGEQAKRMFVDYLADKIVEETR